MGFKNIKFRELTVLVAVHDGLPAAAELVCGSLDRIVAGCGNLMKLVNISALLLDQL